jgi:hypothetical protein
VVEAPFNGGRWSSFAYQTAVPTGGKSGATQAADAELESLWVKASTIGMSLLSVVAQQEHFYVE